MWYRDNKGNLWNLNRVSRVYQAGKVIGVWVGRQEEVLETLLTQEEAEMFMDGLSILLEQHLDGESSGVLTYTSVLIEGYPSGNGGGESG